MLHPLRKKQQLLHPFTQLYHKKTAVDDIDRPVTTQNPENPSQVLREVVAYGMCPRGQWPMNYLRYTTSVISTAM